VQANQQFAKSFSPNMSMSDGLLAQMALEGDQRAFEALVRRYSNTLFNFVYRVLGE